MTCPLDFGSLPDCIGLGHAASVARQAAERINQVAMAAWIDQRAIIMLPVDLDQRLPDLAQELDTHADVVDEGAAPAVGPLNATQDESVLWLKPIGGEELKYRMAWRKIEARGHLALWSTPPHQRGIATPADGKGERVEQNRFAGTGFPGQRRKTWAEFEIEFVDQNDVADRQRG